MKLIHLSDFYFGKRINEFSMIEEQEQHGNQVQNGQEGFYGDAKAYIADGIEMIIKLFPKMYLVQIRRAGWGKPQVRFCEGQRQPFTC